MFIAPQPLQRNEPWFEARTIQRQLISLAYLLNNTNWDEEFSKNQFFNSRLTKSKTADNNTIRKLLINAWNTEYLLSLNQEIANQSGRAFVLHWAFPQAYYSVFGTLLAHFNALGYNHTSHQGVMRHYAQLAADKKLPMSVCIHCDGSQGNITFHGIQPSSTASHFYLDVGSSESRAHQICQALKSTRQLNLEKKKDDFKFITKAGKPKQQLSAADWARVSERLGPTTIMDLLYRKRIKSNYGDVDSYISEDFADGARILQYLRDVVRWMSFVNEAYTAKAVGWDTFEQIYNIYKGEASAICISQRINYLKDIATR